MTKKQMRLLSLLLMGPQMGGVQGKAARMKWQRLHPITD
jgi:hypothetical protein